MDTLTIKNKLANWLAFKDTKNLNLEAPAINRLNGNFLNVVKYKKNLINCVHSIFDQLETIGMKVEFVKSNSPYYITDSLRFDLVLNSFVINDPPELARYVRPSEIEAFKANITNVKLVNKLDKFIWNRDFFDLTSVALESRALDLKDQIQKRWDLKDDELNGTMVKITTPRVYFDYFMSCFKVEFRVVTAKNPNKEAKREAERIVAQAKQKKWMQESAEKNRLEDEKLIEKLLEAANKSPDKEFKEENEFITTDDSKLEEVECTPFLPKTKHEEIEETWNRLELEPRVYKQITGYKSLSTVFDEWLERNKAETSHKLINAGPDDPIFSEADFQEQPFLENKENLTEFEKVALKTSMEK